TQVRLSRLEATLAGEMEAHQKEKARQEHRQRIYRGFCDVLNRMPQECPDLSDAEIQAIRQALQRHDNEGIEHWLRDLEWGRSVPRAGWRGRPVLRLGLLRGAGVSAPRAPRVRPRGGRGRPRRKLPPVSEWKLKPGFVVPPGPVKFSDMQYDLP